MDQSDIHSWTAGHRTELILGGVIVILLGALVTGASPAEDGEETVTIVASELIGFEPMSYAISHRKVPEPDGLNIELKTASFTGASLHTITTQEPVLGVLSNTRLIESYNRNQTFEVMAPWYREGMCGHREMSVGQLVTAKGSAIQEPEDLYGATVGLIGGRTGGSAMALQTALRTQGINLDRINFTAVESEMAPVLVREGRVDAAMFDSSYVVDPSFNESWRTVMDFGEVLHNTYGAVPPSQFVVVREQHYEDNPRRYDRATQWLRDNFEWARDNIEQVSQVRSRGEGEAAGRPVDVLVDKSTCFTRIGTFTEKDKQVLQEYYATAQEIGAIETVPDLDAVFDGAVEREY